MTLADRKKIEIRRIASGQRTSPEGSGEHKRTVQTLPRVVGATCVSIEVFADLNTSVGTDAAAGRREVLVDSNAYVKYPRTLKVCARRHASLTR